MSANRIFNSAAIKYNGTYGKSFPFPVVAAYKELRFPRVRAKIKRIYQLSEKYRMDSHMQTHTLSAKDQTFGYVPYIFAFALNRY